MITRNEIGTWGIVTAVSGLIWVWAASETREQRMVDYASITFTVGDPGEWSVEPMQRSIVVQLDGPKQAIQQAEAIFRSPVRLELPEDTGQYTVDLKDRLQRHDLIAEAGVSIVSVDPATVHVNIDQIITVEATVGRTVPRVQTEGDVTVNPPTVQMLMSQTLRRQYQGALRVDLVPDPEDIRRLAPGVQKTIQMNVRPPAGLEQVTISPPSVQVTFTIRSQTEQYKLDSVRVQVAGPPEDAAEYDVEVEPKQLNDVTITADSDLIRRIRDGEVQVYAMVHLSSADKESLKTSEAVSAFWAVPADDESRSVQVNGQVGDSESMPVIKLRIRRRQGEAEGS